MNDEKIQLQAKLNEALNLHRKGDLLQAKRIYEQILKVDSNYPDALHNLGVMAIQYADLNGAVVLFGKALDLDKSKKQYWISYIDALLISDEVEKATIACDEWAAWLPGGEEIEAQRVKIKLAREIAEGRRQLELLEETRKYQEMEHYALGLIKSHGKHPKLLQGLALSYLYQKKNDEALISYQELVQMFPRDANLWNQYALTLKQLKRYLEAHDAFLKSLQLSPKHPDILANIGENLNCAGNFAESIVWLKQGLDIAPDSIALRTNYANALFMLGQVSQSKTIFQSVLAEGAHVGPATVNYARLLVEIGEPEKK